MVDTEFLHETVIAHWIVLPIVACACLAGSVAAGATDRSTLSEIVIECRYRFFMTRGFFYAISGGAADIEAAHVSHAAERP
jgi:hypothetical protein